MQSDMMSSTLLVISYGDSFFTIRASTRLINNMLKFVVEVDVERARIDILFKLL